MLEFYKYLPNTSKYTNIIFQKFYNKLPYKVLDTHYSNGSMINSDNNIALNESIVGLHQSNLLVIALP